LFRVWKGSDAEGPGDPATLFVRIKAVFRQRVLQHLFNVVMWRKQGFLRNIADTCVTPLPAGVPRIEVTFLIDANGILNVMAKDMRTGETQSIEVKPSYGLSDQEVERMIEDSFKFAADDVNARKLIEARLDAGALITTTEKSLADGGHLVATGDVEAIRTALSALATAKDGSDPRAIRARMADIEQAAKGLTVAMLDDSLKQGLQGKKVSDVTQS